MAPRARYRVSSSSRSTRGTTMGTTTPEALTPDPTPQAETPITPDPQTIPQTVTVPAITSPKVAALYHLAPTTRGPVVAELLEYTTTLEAIRQILLKINGIYDRLHCLGHRIHRLQGGIHPILQEGIHFFQDSIHSKVVEMLDVIENIEDIDIQQAALELIDPLVNQLGEL
ncbi:hypothetical protein N7454_002957 [Penicillium verhagenii]|nr:hypothetical protein N7454_002957 [Penicillium verhagenii]